MYQENPNLRKVLVNKSLFAVPPVISCCYPDNDHFVNLNGAILKSTGLTVSLTDIDEWFCERAADHSNREGRNLFVKKFVKTLKIADEGGLFIYSFVAAAKSRNKEYGAKAKLEKNGHILQATCECPVGDGFSASCKHIAAMMYALEFFYSAGELLLWRAPTECLQSWLQPKPGRHAGHAKAGHLSKRMPKKITIKVKPNLNTIISKSTNADLGIGIQTFRQKVNVNAMCQDHDYLDVDPVVKFCDNINKISLTQINTLKNKTIGQAKSCLWWNARKSRISGSVAGCICKTVRNKNFSKCYAQSIVSPRHFSNAAMKWGKNNEMRAIAQYEKTTGSKITKLGFCISSKYNFFGSSPDGISDDGEIVLEVKCPYSIKDKVPAAAKYLKNGFLNRNHQYYFQCQSHMLVTGAKRCDFVIFTEKEIYIENIKFSETFCSRMITDVKNYYEKIFVYEYINKNLFL